MTNIVKQKGASDCQIATIAMCLGVSYTAVKRKIGKKTFDHIWKTGTSNTDFLEILKKFGLHSGVDFKNIPIYYPNDLTVIKELLWHRRAILSVASLNNHNGSHALYWDGTKIFDPSTRQTYTWLSSLIISRIVLFK